MGVIQRKDLMIKEFLDTFRAGDKKSMMFIWHFVFITLHFASYGVSSFPSISTTITIPTFNARRKGPKVMLGFLKGSMQGRVFFSGFIGFLLTL